MRSIRRSSSWEGLEDPRKMICSTPQVVFLQPRYVALLRLLVFCRMAIVSRYSGRLIFAVVATPHLYQIAPFINLMANQFILQLTYRGLVTSIVPITSVMQHNPPFKRDAPEACGVFWSVIFARPLTPRCASYVNININHRATATMQHAMIIFK